MSSIQQRIKQLHKIAERWQEEVNTASALTELTQKDVNLLRRHISRVGKKYAETLYYLSEIENELRGVKE